MQLKDILKLTTGDTWITVYNLDGDELNCDYARGFNQECEAEVHTIWVHNDNGICMHIEDSDSPLWIDDDEE